MRRTTRRVPIVGVLAVACLLLTSCAYMARVSGEFGPSAGALTSGGDISNDGSMVVFLSTRAIDAEDTNNEFDVFVRSPTRGRSSVTWVRRVGVSPV